MKYKFNFVIEVLDEELNKLCAEDMPCADFLREAVITTLASFPSKILLAEVELVKPQILEDTLCPDCGAKMVSRKSQHGIFWGCSNYPKCKGTRDTQGRSKADREAQKSDRKDREWTVNGE